MTAADLVADPALADGLRVARAWGVPPSVFSGAVKRSHTGYSYDDTGRLRETWTEHEPLWTDEDRELAFALAAYEADLCQCGRPLAETMNAAHEFAYRGELAGRCHACTAQAAATAPFEGSPHPDALRFRVTLDPVRAAAGRARVAAQEADDGAGRGEDGAGAAGAPEPGAAGGSEQGTPEGAEPGPAGRHEAVDGGGTAELREARPDPRGPVEAGEPGADDDAAAGRR